MTFQTVGYAVQNKSSPLAPWKFTRRDLKPTDVHIKVKRCGICHTDIHFARDEWGGISLYPMVPGHEIVGTVEAVGKDVVNTKKGDLVGVGFIVDSCEQCESCKAGEEEYCSKSFVPTLSGKDYNDETTQGGFSSDIVVKERFCFKVPSHLNINEAAPLLCAGITVYAPMKRWGADQAGKKIGVVGMGGLGHMAVKFGKAFGNEVTVISRSANKKETAMKMGATNFVVSTDSEQMKSAVGSLDFIIDTVSAQKPLGPLTALMKAGGVYCFVGIPNANEVDAKVNQMSLIFSRHAVVGSLVGGSKATQEMLDFCGEKNVSCDVEVIKANYINEAYERVLKGDVFYRFVIDIENSMPSVENIV